MELTGAASLEVVDAEAVEPRIGLGQGLPSALAAEQEGERHVLDGRELRHQLPELEEEAERSPPQLGAVALAEVVDPTTGEMHLALVGSEDAGHAVQQGRLARPRRGP